MLHLNKKEKKTQTVLVVNLTWAEECIYPNCVVISVTAKNIKFKVYFQWFFHAST